MFETANGGMDHRQLPLAVTYVGETGCNRHLTIQHWHDTYRAARRNLRIYEPTGYRRVTWSGEYVLCKPCFGRGVGVLLLHRCR